MFLSDSLVYFFLTLTKIFFSNRQVKNYFLASAYLIDSGVSPVYENELSESLGLSAEEMTNATRLLLLLFMPLMVACSSTFRGAMTTSSACDHDNRSLAGFCSLASTSTKPSDPNGRTYCDKSSREGTGARPGTANPLAGQLKFPVPTGCLSSPFGYRLNNFHSGIDITAPKGDPILACADGTVIFAGTMKAYRRYGQMIVIDHGGDVITRYAHASRLLVKTGQKVRLGENIALVGGTGRATSPHLHLEVEVAGRLYNPLACFSENQLRSIRVANGFPLAPVGPIRTGWLMNSDLLSSMR